jgi:hypothetical protein
VDVQSHALLKPTFPKSHQLQLVDRSSPAYTGRKEATPAHPFAASSQSPSKSPGIWREIGNGN